MPRIHVSAQYGKQGGGATMTCEAADSPQSANNTMAPSSPPLQHSTALTTTVATADINGCLPPASPPAKTFGFGEGVCTCARCMRRAGPIREDVEERATQIAYVLAGVYVDSPNPEEMVKEAHKAKARDFMQAVEAGNVGKLKSLFDSLDGGDGMVEEIATELIISAAQLGHSDLVRMLSDKGADVEEKDLRRGGRPLMHAANNGHTAAVKALIECNADMEARDDNGYTALMVAIFSDRSSAAEALLKHGALVDAIDDKGRTAMSYAAMYGSTDCVYLLANYGANVFHTDKDGSTPLELAEDSGRTAAVDALRKLQVKHKMQERRKHRQRVQGCHHLSNDDLARREAEAALHAAELLMAIEQEQADKKAKATKQKSKKKASKGKGSDCGSTGGGPHLAYGQDGVDDALHHHQHHHPASSMGNGECGHEPGPGRQHLHTGIDCPPPLDPADSAKHLAGPDSPASTEGSPHSDAQQPCDGTESAAGTDLEAVRREWDALLEAANKCMDESAQPLMLERVEALLPRCQELGISVKYGKKVLQRLQQVGPARDALRSALAAQPVARLKLDVALRAAKRVSCLLDAQWLADSEVLLERLRREDEERKWNSLATALSWDTHTGKGSPGGVIGYGHAKGYPDMSGSTTDDLMDMDQECVVCLSAVKSAACVPCGHVCMCMVCADSVHSASGVCPVCRSNIECIVDINY